MSPLNTEPLSPLKGSNAVLIGLAIVLIKCGL